MIIVISLFFKNFLSSKPSDKSSQGESKIRLSGLSENPSSTVTPAANPPPADSPIQIDWSPS